MGTDSNTWIGTCCKEAVEQLSSLGFNLTVDPYRISVWNRVFRRDGKFPHPNHYVANGLKPKPPIFDVFPEAAAMTSEFVYSHLDHITVEGGPQEKMSFFQIASGPILSIPIYLKTCLYGPYYFRRKKMTPSSPTNPPKSAFFCISDWTSDSVGFTSE